MIGEGKRKRDAVVGKEERERGTTREWHQGHCQVKNISVSRHWRKGGASPREEHRILTP
jgi:hypothetical protein